MMAASRPSTARLRPARGSSRGRLALAGLALLAIAGAILALTALAALTGFDGSAGPSATAGTPASPVVVRVTAGTEIATGFALDRDRIVTVAHVLDRRLAVNGRRARIARVNRGADLAVLSVHVLTGTGAPATAASAAPRTAAGSAGDTVGILRLRDGRVSSLSGHVRRRIVAHVRVNGAPAATRPALELAARVRPGDSGAPIVNESGAIVGVIFAASSGNEDTVYAVDAGPLMRLLAPN
jgi:hypothetical protein